VRDKFKSETKKKSTNNKQYYLCYVPTGCKVKAMPQKEDAVALTPKGNEERWPPKKRSIHQNRLERDDVLFCPRIVLGHARANGDAGAPVNCYSPSNLKEGR
jgi:hypothetical protein